MAAEQSGDPGRTPGSAEGDLETIEEDLREKHLDKDATPPASGQDVDQHSSGGDRKEAGKVSGKQDDQMNKRGNQILVKIQQNRNR